MNYVCAIATEIVELIDYLFIMAVLFHCKLNWKKYISIIVLAAHALIWTVCIVEKGNMTDRVLIASSVSIIISIFFIVDEVLWKKCVIFFIAVALLGCLDLGVEWVRVCIFYIVFHRKIELILEFDWWNMLDAIAIFICLLGLSAVIKKIHQKQKMMLSWKNIILMASLMYCCLIIIFYIIVSIPYMSNRLLNVVALSMAFILEILLAAYFVSYMITDYSKNFYQQQNEQKQKMLAVQKQYFQSIEANQEKIRSMQHDMKNMIGTVSIMMGNNSYEEAKGYLEKWQDELSATKFIKVTQNSTIDAVLHYESMEAMNKNVVIDMHSSVPDWDDVEEYKLWTILLNAIYITVENPSDRKAQEIQDGITTKEGEGHGYGIKNIREAVESFHGSMEYRQKGGKIVLEICLFIE